MRTVASVLIPDGFATALTRAMPYTVGVYAVGSAATAKDKLGLLDLDAGPDDGIESPSSGDNVGAGFLLRADGLVATAAHVVAGSERVIVKLADERILQATIVGVDTVADVALLKIDERWTTEPPLGDSGTLRAGDWVLAVGEPFAIQRTVVAGIVGGPARHFVEDREVVFIQSDINLNPGHSGGPLLDARGLIVGLNARAIAGPYGMAGMSLTVPIEAVVRVAHRIQQGQPAGKPGFGASFQDLLPPQAFEAGLTRASGAIVREVHAGGLAARAGLRPNDVVVGFNGLPVGDGADLARLLNDAESSEPVRIIVFRDRAYHELVAR